MMLNIYWYKKICFFSFLQCLAINGAATPEGSWKIFWRVASRYFMYTDVLHLLYSGFRWGSLGYCGLLKRAAVEKSLKTTAIKKNKTIFEEDHKKVSFNFSYFSSRKTLNFRHTFSSGFQQSWKILQVTTSLFNYCNRWKAVRTKRNWKKLFKCKQVKLR